MTDKDKIKEEIEKRLSLLWDLIPEGEKILQDNFTKEDAYNLGKYTELESLLKLIDSLPEENHFEDKSKIVSEDLEDIIDIVRDKKIMYASREAGIKCFAETYSFNIESVLFNQLTLEQQELWRKEIENAAINGGEMGLELADDKRYDKELGEDLEEASEKYAFTNWESDDYHEGASEFLPFDPIGHTKKCFIAGAEWQKHQMKEVLQTEYEKGRFDMREEMMKYVVEGEVVYKIGNAEIAPTDVRYKVMSDRVYIPNVKLGDKVKIIILKTE